ncbi:MAG: hypothetical protein GF353_27040, partial [Candidatus Lokiarchaeota archaeon]|nr:hypothetical protein [Candidatus Lokiarchaeota archaeon]
MTKIKVVCPKCSKKGFFELPENILKNVSRGVMSVNIPQNLFCEHSYLVYIDKNFQIRDYFFTDFKIELPKLSPVIDLKEEKLSSTNLEKFSSIKLFITAASLSYVIKGIISKKKIVFIIDTPHLKNNFHDFFSFLTQNSYETDILILTMEEHKGN